MRKEVVAHKDPKSPISEIFRTLRTNIQFMSNSKKLKTLLVTSSFPGEGKSWVVSNLAVTFAQAGKRVILIDADMRKGRQYAIFGIAPKPGLSNLLSEMDDETDGAEFVLDYIQQTDVENLFVITAGNVPPNPSELLVAPTMKKVLTVLKEMCDIIIIDGTPCELVTDSVILSRRVDSTVIVTAHKKTKKDVLRKIIKNIKNVGGNIAGVVINRIPVSTKKYGEKYYYYGHDKFSKKSNKKSVQDNIEFNQNRLAETLKRDKTSKEVLIEQEMNKKTNEKNIINENSNIKSEKTNDILNQINAYLEQEKKDLN